MATACTPFSIRLTSTCSIWIALPRTGGSASPSSRRTVTPCKRASGSSTRSASPASGAHVDGGLLAALAADERRGCRAGSAPARSPSAAICSKASSSAVGVDRPGPQAPHAALRVVGDRTQRLVDLVRDGRRHLVDGVQAQHARELVLVAAQRLLQLLHRRDVGRHAADAVGRTVGAVQRELHAHVAARGTVADRQILLERERHRRSPARRRRAPAAARRDAARTARSSRRPTTVTRACPKRRSNCAVDEQVAAADVLQRDDRGRVVDGIGRAAARWRARRRCTRRRSAISPASRSFTVCSAAVRSATRCSSTRVQLAHLRLGAAALLQLAPVCRPVALELARDHGRQHEAHHHHRGGIGRQRAQGRRPCHRIAAVSAAAPTATVTHCGPSPQGSTVAVSSAAPTNSIAVVTYSPVGLAMPGRGDDQIGEGDDGDRQRPSPRLDPAGAQREEAGQWQRNAGDPKGEQRAERVVGGEHLVDDEERRHRRDDDEDEAQPIQQLALHRRFVPTDCCRLGSPALLQPH